MYKFKPSPGSCSVFTGQRARDHTSSIILIISEDDSPFALQFFLSSRPNIKVLFLSQRAVFKGLISNDIYPPESLVSIQSLVTLWDQKLQLIFQSQFTVLSFIHLFSKYLSSSGEALGRFELWEENFNRTKKHGKLEVT